MIKEFGTTIKNARLAKDLSLRDLAELTGLDHSYIARLEKGGSIPSRDTVAKLSKALKISEDELMIKAGYVPNHNPSPTLDDELNQIMRELGPEVTLQFYDLKGMTQEEKEQLKIFLEGLKARRKEKKGNK